MALTNPLLEQYSWYSRLYLHLPSLIHILDTLRSDPLKSEAGRVWLLLCSSYQSTPHMMLNIRNHIHVSIRNLFVKAYNAREAALENIGMPLPPIPDLIVIFREQQRRYSDRKSSQSKTTILSENASSQSAIDRSQVAGRSMIESNTDLSDLDPFWFVDDAFDRSRNNQATLTIVDNYDPGHIDSLSNANFEDITWAQWDAWLSGSELPSQVMSRGLR